MHEQQLYVRMDVLLCASFKYRQEANMHKLNLDQFRTTVETGGVISVALVATGGAFHIEAETRKGSAVLTKARGPQPREFRDVTKALGLLRELGIQEARVDARDWRPEAAAQRAARPDSAAQLRAAHEAADLKRTLEERIRKADDPNSVWHDHDALFDELEARYAD
jgi:hypothetical protein